MKYYELARNWSRKILFPVLNIIRCYDWRLWFLVIRGLFKDIKNKLQTRFEFRSVLWFVSEIMLVFRQLLYHSCGSTTLTHSLVFSLIALCHIYNCFYILYSSNHDIILVTMLLNHCVRNTVSKGRLFP